MTIDTIPPLLLEDCAQLVKANSIQGVCKCVYHYTPIPDNVRSILVIPYSGLVIQQDKRYSYKGSYKSGG